MQQWNNCTTRACVSTSRLTLHVQNFVIWVNQIFEFGRSCNLIHALLRLYLTHWTRWFCLLTDSTIGIFRIMSDHRVVFSWLGTHDTLLAIGIFCQNIWSSISYHRTKFLCYTLFFDNFTLTITPSFWIWRRCISYLLCFCRWLQQIEHGVLRLLFSLKMSLWLSINPKDGYASVW